MNLKQKKILQWLLLMSILFVGSSVVANDLDNVDLDNAESEYDFQSPEEQQNFKQQFNQDVETTNNAGDSGNNNANNLNDDNDYDSFVGAINSAEIISPKNGEIIFDEYLKLKIKAPGAVKAEAYYKRLGSSQKNYLGKFKNLSGDIWQLKIKVSQYLPNGQYRIIIKIKNNDGEYELNPLFLSVSYFSGNDQSETKKNYDSISDLPQSPTGTTGFSQKHSSGNIPQKPKNLTKDDVKSYTEKADADGDGLFNKEELRIGTDPFNPDTDGDGFLDGDEVKNGYDPLKASDGKGSDKMIFQDPREKGKIKKDFKIKEVKLVKKKKAEDHKKNQKEEKKILLSGKAIPNAFVNIYIYSQAPIIVTVKTDSQGNWSYELDKNIADGEHEAYVVLTDNTGKITAKSKPFYFVKTAQAVSAGKKEPSLDHSLSPIKENQRKSVIYLIIIITAFSISALGLIGFTINQKKSGKK